MGKCIKQHPSANRHLTLSLSKGNFYSFVPISIDLSIRDPVQMKNLSGPLLD